MAVKARQAEVRNRPAQRERRCGACGFFSPGPQEGDCHQVEGSISLVMCCDMWRPLKRGGPSAGAGSGGPPGPPQVA